MFLFDSQANTSSPYWANIISPEDHYNSPYFVVVESADWDQQSVRDKYQTIIGEGATYLTCREGEHYYDVRIKSRVGNDRDLPET